jgi:hypothetical protein
MSDDSKRARHRQRQVAYEARQRAGLRLYPAPLGAAEIDALVALGGSRMALCSTAEVLASAFRETAPRCV